MPYRIEHPAPLYLLNDIGAREKWLSTRYGGLIPHWIDTETYPFGTPIDDKHRSDLHMYPGIHGRLAQHTSPDLNLFWLKALIARYRERMSACEIDPSTIQEYELFDPDIIAKVVPMTEVTGRPLFEGEPEELLLVEPNRTDVQFDFAYPLPAFYRPYVKTVLEAGGIASNQYIETQICRHLQLPETPVARRQAYDKANMSKNTLVNQALTPFFGDILRAGFLEGRGRHINKYLSLCLVDTPRALKHRVLSRVAESDTQHRQMANGTVKFHIGMAGELKTSTDFLDVPVMVFDFGTESEEQIIVFMPDLLGQSFAELMTQGVSDVSPLLNEEGWQGMRPNSMRELFQKTIKSFPQGTPIRLSGTTLQWVE